MGSGRAVQLWEVGGSLVSRVPSSCSVLPLVTLGNSLPFLKLVFHVQNEGDWAKTFRRCFQPWRPILCFHLADYSSSYSRAPFVWEKLEFWDGVNDKLALEEDAVIRSCSCLVILRECRTTSGWNVKVYQTLSWTKTPFSMRPNHHPQKHY